jgi:hypothetical protein
MRSPHTTRTVGRTVVVAAWLLVLTVAGEPFWLVALLATLLLLVWMSPYLLATNRAQLRVRSSQGVRAAGR